MVEPREIDVLVAGAGPAGIAAAVEASACGARVAVVDDNPLAGGQIWRGGEKHAPSGEAASWLRRWREAGVERLAGSRIVAFPARGVALIEDDAGAFELRFEKLILATGARERFLPFPGWTLPGVVGAGGLQALIKGGLPVRGKRVVVAGSGPLLLAVAGLAAERGARVTTIAEQAPAGRLRRFALGLLGEPGKLRQTLQLRSQCSDAKYRPGCWVIRATGEERVEAVVLRAGTREWEEPCDYLACGFGLVPNLELAALLGCRTEAGAVVVDERQETSVDGVYAAGEVTGIGGVDLALLEGRIAGLVAAGRPDEAERLTAKRDRARRLANRLERTFALRDELRELADEDTIVCRCEDVRLGQLRRHDCWRSAKLQTRIGMGACQGRVCGAAAEFLFGWNPESVRPPASAARLGTLAGGSAPDSLRHRRAG